MLPHFLAPAAFILLLLLTSCGGLRSTPTADPHAQQAIENMAAKIAFKNPQNINTPGHVRIPLAKGQWVTTLARYKNHDGDRILSTTKVIDVQQDLVTLEVENFTASQKGERNVTLVQIAGYPVNLPVGPDQEAIKAITSQARILRMVTQAGDNPPSEMPPAYLQFASNLMKDFINPAVRTTPISTQPVETPYIRTRDAKIFDVEVSVLGFKDTGKIQAHGGVPVNNQVLYENTDQIIYTIAYGLKGAKQTLFFPPAGTGMQ
ncbi:hypothetical protein [Desulfobotulus mexicanus]|uniref:Uncharacterized protein n=1 Tax=Desulfobotulus mexicanus TaxID=2586642 RepID=A0A5S5MCZ7_9BACT|nr:hypothetical protein [Desulfobotulus mexicanus]TYT73587.1 hypothetical protein FIM25_14375 [Desulfobotulus mexicanus]